MKLCKIICFLMAALMLLCAFVACDNKKTPSTDNGGQLTGDGQSPEEKVLHPDGCSRLRMTEMPFALRRK